MRDPLALLLSSAVVAAIFVGLPVLVTVVARRRRRGRLAIELAALLGRDVRAAATGSSRLPRREALPLALLAVAGLVLAVVDTAWVSGLGLIVLLAAFVVWAFRYRYRVVAVTDGDVVLVGTTSGFLPQQVIGAVPRERWVCRAGPLAVHGSLAGEHVELPKLGQRDQLRQLSGGPRR